MGPPQTNRKKLAKKKKFCDMTTKLCSFVEHLMAMFLAKFGVDISSRKIRHHDVRHQGIRCQIFFITFITFFLYKVHAPKLAEIQLFDLLQKLQSLKAVAIVDPKIGYGASPGIKMLIIFLKKFQNLGSTIDTAFKLGSF